MGSALYGVGRHRDHSRDRRRRRATARDGRATTARLAIAVIKTASVADTVAAQRQELLHEYRVEKQEKPAKAPANTLVRGSHPPRLSRPDRGDATHHREQPLRRLADQTDPPHDRLDHRERLVVVEHELRREGPRRRAPFTNSAYVTASWMIEAPADVEPAPTTIATIEVQGGGGRHGTARSDLK